MAEFTDEHVGRTSDHYKVQRPLDQKRDLEPPPNEDVPDVDEHAPDDSSWEDEKRRQERGNRGPDEEPGFGQGA